MHLPVVIAVVTVARFSQKVDSRGFKNGRFGCNLWRLDIWISSRGQSTLPAFSTSQHVMKNYSFPHSIEFTVRDQFIVVGDKVQSFIGQTDIHL
jgi:hypothetical protein